MSEGFDITLLSTGALIKKSYSALIANVGKAIAVITLIIAALVSFTEIGFSDAGAESFTSTLIMMLIASYIMYFSLEDAGEKLGRESEDYKSALTCYEEKRAQIGGEDIKELRKFCFDYQSEELEYRKLNALMSLGYTMEEYESYKRGERTDKHIARKLSRIDRLKRSDIEAADLLTKGSARVACELKRPGISRLIFMFCRLIPSTVCMFFTISVMISAKDGLTFSSVLESIMKLSTLPIIGLKGYSAGYEYALGGELSWLNIKTDLLDAFIKQRKTQKTL